MHVTRAYNQFDINKVLGTIKKISSNSKLADEAAYYNDISKTKALSLFPRMLDYGTNYIVMEYYGYNNLGDSLLNSNQSKLFWENTFSLLFEHLAIFKSMNYNFADYTTCLHKMYVDKTLFYYDELIKSSNYFEKLADNKIITINGKRTKNFMDIWPDINNMINDLLLVRNNSKATAIHGDMCFSNILIGKNKHTNQSIIRYIDPRGSFGGHQGIYGDSYYDIAKLLHSCDGGYEYIINNKFILKEDNELKNFTLTLENCNYINAYNTLVSMISKDDLVRIKLIEGLIFIGMCSRHYTNKHHQIAMFLTGVRLLNEILL